MTMTINNIISMSVSRNKLHNLKHGKKHWHCSNISLLRVRTDRKLCRTLKITQGLLRARLYEPGQLGLPGQPALLGASASPRFSVKFTIEFIRAGSLACFQRSQLL